MAPSSGEGYLCTRPLNAHFFWASNFLLARLAAAQILEEEKKTSQLGPELLNSDPRQLFLFLFQNCCRGLLDACKPLPTESFGMIFCVADSGWHGSGCIGGVCYIWAWTARNSNDLCIYAVAASRS